MSGATHTPGPWVADNNEGFSQWSIWSRKSPTGHGDAGPKVASVHGESAEADANANLIAAAPELLEAAKLVLAWYEAENDHSKEPDFWARVEMCRASEEALRAAIAKAEGL